MWNEGTFGNSNHNTKEGSPNYAIDWKEVFHNEHAKLLASSNAQNGSSLKFKSGVNNNTRKNNDMKIIKEEGKSRRGKEQKNPIEFNGVVAKLKHKALQKRHNTRRNDFTSKGKFY